MLSTDRFFSIELNGWLYICAPYMVICKSEWAGESAACVEDVVAFSTIHLMCSGASESQQFRTKMLLPPNFEEKTKTKHSAQNKGENVRILWPKTS